MGHSRQILPWYQAPLLSHIAREYHEDRLFSVHIKKAVKRLRAQILLYSFYMHQSLPSRPETENKSLSILTLTTLTEFTNEVNSLHISHVQPPSSYIRIWSNKWKWPISLLWASIAMRKFSGLLYRLRPKRSRPCKIISSKRIGPS